LICLKKCIKCGSNKVVKNGKTNYGKQLFLCKHCGSQFVHRYQNVKRQKKLINEYVFGKQTLKQLATKYGKTTKTVQKHLDRYYVTRSAGPNTQPIVIGVDCCFFGRGYGIIVARRPGLKQNLYWKEINTENKAVYEEARKYLERNGFTVKAVVIDAKHGIKEAFSGMVVQICQYHQQQVIQRYLTDKSKTLAGLELKFVASSFTYQKNKLLEKNLKNGAINGDRFLLSALIRKMENIGGILIDAYALRTVVYAQIYLIYSTIKTTLNLISLIRTTRSKDILVDLSNYSITIMDLNNGVAIS
jgi:hypothetical protein